MWRLDIRDIPDWCSACGGGCRYAASWATLTWVVVCRRCGKFQNVLVEDQGEFRFAPTGLSSGEQESTIPDEKTVPE